MMKAGRLLMLCFILALLGCQDEMTDSSAHQLRNGTLAFVPCADDTRSNRYEGAPVEGATYTTMLTEDVFHVSGYSYDPTSGETANNVPAPNFFVNEDVSYIDGVWRASGPYHVPAATDRTDFFFWFTPQNTEGVTMPDDQEGGLRLTYQVPLDVTKHPDLLTALTPGYVYDEDDPAAVPVTFHHQLTELHFLVGENLSPGTIEEIAFVDVCTKGTLAVADGTSGTWQDITRGDIAFPLSFPTRLDRETRVGDTILTSVMMIPQQFTAATQRIRIKLNLQNIETHYLYATLKDLGAGAWVAGQSVTYRLSSSALRQDEVIDITDVTPKDFGKVIGNDGRVYEHNDYCKQSTGVDGVAMIAYVGENPGDADNALVDGQLKYRGLAIARTDAPYITTVNGTTNINYAPRWSTERLYSCPYFSEKRFTKIWDASTGKFGDLNGIRSTTLLANALCKKQADTPHTHEAAIAAATYQAPSDPTFDPTDFGMSPWFLPTASQWIKFYGACGVPIEYWTSTGYCPGEGNTKYPAANDNTDRIEGTLLAIGFDALPLNLYYWSSSEVNSENAWGTWMLNTYGVNFTTGLTKIQTERVRPFLAF